MDGIAVASTALAMRALLRAVKSLRSTFFTAAIIRLKLTKCLYSYKCHNANYQLLLLLNATIAMNKLSERQTTDIRRPSCTGGKRPSLAASAPADASQDHTGTCSPSPES